LEALFDQLGAVVGNVLDSVPVRLVIFGAFTYVTVVWLAVAHWVYRDMRRRRPDPATPYLAAAAMILASPVLLPLSTFTYLVLRPAETVAETRERELGERLDALDAELDLACPGCGLPVEADWLVCPDCRSRLARRCRTCGRTMGLDWALCGWCGSEFGPSVTPRRLPAALLRAPIDQPSAAGPRGGLLEPGS